MESKEDSSTSQAPWPSGLLGDLVAPSSAFKITEFCERLIKMDPVFMEHRVATACISLLSCDALIHHVDSRADSKAPMDIRTIKNACSQLLQFLLDSLTHCNHEGYLVVFRAIHAFSQGTWFLSENDKAFLLEQLKMTNIEGELSQWEATSSGDSLKEEVLFSGGPESVKEFFDRLSSANLLSRSSSPSVRAFKVDKKSSQKDEFTKVCAEILRDLKSENILLDFCLRIPVLKMADNNINTYLSGEDGHATLVKRLLEVSQAVESVSLLLQMSAARTGVNTSQSLDSLFQLLVSCIQVLTTACVAVSGLGKGSRGAGQSSDIVATPSKDTTPTGLMECIADLYSNLSVCSGPPAAKTIVAMVTTSVLKAHVNLFSLLQTLPKLSSALNHNGNTLVVYHILNGLKPLLGQPLSGRGQMGNGEGSGKLFGHVKLSVPVGELFLCAIECLKVLCEETASEEQVVPKDTALTIMTFDLHQTYSSWQCVEMLLSHIPILNILPAVVLAAYKKAMFLSDSRSHAKKDHEPHIRTRTDKQEHLAHKLRLSISEKISEKFPTTELFLDREDDEYSPSSNSTVSSSGDVEGVYNLHSSEKEDSDLSTSDDEATLPHDADRPLLAPPDHPPFPFIAEFLRRTNLATPLAPPPPPPPLPPRLPPRNIPRRQKSCPGEESPPHGEAVTKKSTFYFSLASYTLATLSRGLLCNTHGAVTEFVRNKIHAEHISCFAWLLRSANSSDFLSILLEMLHSLIPRGLVNEGHQGLLLRELELNTRCWPLRVSPPCLSILGRVLVYRGGLDRSGGGDPLAINIWKGFLQSLEEACVSNDDTDEDFDVVYLQLMLLVWQNFPTPVRSNLLVSCAHAVIKIADLQQRGDPVSSLMTGRLLMVLDYMLFQFSEPPPHLIEQVDHNLFSSYYHGNLSPDSTPKEIMYYSNSFQLQFSTVISKPKGVPKPARRGLQGQGGVEPKFYNVREMGVATDEGETLPSHTQTVDGEACKILLTLTTPEGCVVSTYPQASDNKGYNFLCRSLVSLMGCGMGYEKSQLQLYDRILAACCSHQCFTLCMEMLNRLPPSYPMLRAAIEWSHQPLPYASCLLICVLMLQLKLTTQLIDQDEVYEMFCLTGYSKETLGEERPVVGVVDSQGVALLEELLESMGSTMPPLISLIALDLLVCLLNREVQLRPPQPVSPETLLRNPSNLSDLFPVLLKAIDKLLQWGHLSVLSSSSQLFSPEFSSSDLLALNMMIGVSVKDASAKGTIGRALFGAHFPKSVTERLADFSASILIEGSARNEILTCVKTEDLSCSRSIEKYLDLHFRAFAGNQTFSPVRAIKTAINSCLVLLNDEKVCSPELFVKYVNEISSVSCDCLMDNLFQDVVAGVTDHVPHYGHESVKYKLTECSRVLNDVRLLDSNYYEVILSELFMQMNGLADNKVLHLFTGDNSTTLTDLVRLSAQPPATASVLQCIMFLTKILKEAEKDSPAPHVVAMVEQISKLSSLDQHISEWTKAVFLGTGKGEPSLEDFFNIGFCAKEFFLFLESLKKSNCKVNSDLYRVLLSSLLPVGPELIKLVLSNNQPRLSSTFEYYFNSVILLAGCNADSAGHLVLVKAVESWLPGCAGLLLDTSQHSTKRDGNTSIDVVSPVPNPAVGCLFLYLSQLTSAVLFSTKMLRVTHCKNLAGEFENFVADSEPETDDDGEGMADTVEDSPDEESGDDELDSKLCTFTQTHREFANQHWYCCHTCKLVEGQGVCTICAKVCHKGHDLTYSKYGSFFCDCGAKEDESCKSMVRRESVTGDGSPLSPREENLFSDLHEKKRKKEKKTAKRSNKKASCDTKKPHKEKVRRVPRRNSFPSLPVLKIARQIEGYNSELKDYLDSSSLCASTLQLLHTILPPVVTAIDKASSFGCSPARQAMTDLHQLNKEVEYTDSLMAATLGSQEGAFENVRLNFTGDQGQVIRQLIGAHSIKREAMCTLLSQNGKRQHLCVNHDKGKLTVLQLFPILKQADSNRRKLTLTRLSTTSVPFTVLSMSHSPSKEDHIAVCGLKDAQLLTLNSAGQVTKRESMHPSVGTNGYIVKTLWMPGNHSDLLLVSDTFVKIFDTKADIVSPSYYFELPMGKIRDATIAITNEDKFVVIMTSLGKIYYQPIIGDMSAQDGPVYFTMDLPINHPHVVETDNLVNEGGASVYYSHTLRLLFFSYYDGRSFMMTPNTSFSGYSLICELPLKSSSIAPGSKGGGPALVQWTEVQHHPGLVCALTQTSANPVVILVKPDKVQIQELKALPNKAKVQGMVAMRQPAAPSDPTSQSRTTLMTLCEDGSLRIYVTNKNTNTEFWLQENFHPVSPLGMVKSRIKHTASSRAAVKSRGSPKFPIDFFETCQQLQPNEIDFQGSDILHIYNRQQVRTRLNPGNLYLANNKPSGFTIDLCSRVSATLVMVGVRVLVGCHSVDTAPSFIEVFGQTHSVSFPAGTSRWVDIPFTREQSLQADKEFKINFGPSMDPSGMSFVDCIKVYTRTKVVFGWPEDQPAQTPSPSKHTSELTRDHESDDEGSDIHQTISSRQISPIERLVCDTFDVLSNHCLSVEPEKLPDMSEVVNKATPLLTYSVPFQLQYHFKYLLASTVGSREVYLERKDHIQLSHVVQSLTDCQTKDKLMEPEYFQYLLLLLLKIGKARPDSLAVLAAQVGETLYKATVTEDESANKEKTNFVATFIDLLVRVFWRLFVKTPVNHTVRPVVNPGFALVYVTVACMAEVLWLFVIRDHTLLSTVLNHTLKFLFYADSQVCVPASRAIMKLLKDRKPKKDKQVEPVTILATPTSDTADQEGMAKIGTALLSGVAGPEEYGGDGEPGADSEGVGSGEEDGGGSVEGAEGQEDTSNPEGNPAAEGWQHMPEQPALNLEAALGGNHEMMEQFLANPEQYMMAMNELLPDDDTMMNLAIQLSLQNEGEGGGGMLSEAARPLLAAMGLPPPSYQSSQPQSNASLTGDSEQSLDTNQPGSRSHDQSVAEAPPPPPGGQESGRSSTSSLNSLPRVLMDQSPLLLRSWAQVLQEGQSASSNPPEDGQEGVSAVSGEECDDTADIKQHDMNSEPEIANDTSGDDESGEEDDTIAEKVTEMLDSTVMEKMADNPDTPLLALRRLLISHLLEHLDQAEQVGGLRSISYLQLLLAMTTSLDCTRDDCNLLITIIKTFTSRFDFSSEGICKMIDRKPTHETCLLYLRFLNILMSRKKGHSKEEKSTFASHMLLFTTAQTLLSDTQLLTFCRKLLAEITARRQCLQVAEDSSSPALKSQNCFVHPLEDMNPFFQKQYTKANSTDIFAAYCRLLSEILLVLPRQLKKAGEVSKSIPPPEFGPDWIATLCDFFLKVSQSTGVGRRHVRKLLLHICGSKDSYRLTRDVHALRNHMSEIVATCRTSGFNPDNYTGLPVHMAYTSMLKVIEQLKVCKEIAVSRTSSWQAFCQMEKNTLPYLFHASFVLDEGLAPLILQLLYAALSGSLPVPVKTTNGHGSASGLTEAGIMRRAVRKEKELAKVDKETKQPEPNKEVCASLVQMFMSFVDSDSLEKFITLYLLQTNSTPLRWQTHHLLHTLYEYSQTPDQISLVESLWKLWPLVPSYGRKATQFVDLLGFLSLSTPQVLDKESLCETYVERAIDLLRKQNSLVSIHPNFHIYSQLQNLVDFDGFYLENEPCLVCNDPEIPYGVSKLQSIKSEIKYSPKMILVKLVSSFTISQLSIRISDIKRTKMVRTVNVYYSNRTVQNVIELKNKRKMWMTARSTCLTPGQNEVKIEFPLPIVASNLVIEFRDFYDNLQAGSEVLQCPRCQASVSAHPGVCGTCGENVYQCHKCRAINYDEKDPFLCNSCGFSKYAKFDVYVESKPSSAVDPIESEDDRHKTTTRINLMLERADNVYKILVQYRSGLDQLLGSPAGGIIVSSRATQVLPTDTGANKGILLVAQKYSIDCKSTYQELSKIIQGVLASRRELVSYDHRILEFGTGVIPEEMDSGDPSNDEDVPGFNMSSQSPGATSIPPVVPSDTTPTDATPTPHIHQGWCFGCSSAAIEHCITLLKALAFVSPTKHLLVKRNLIRELVGTNLTTGSLQTRTHVRRLLCQLTRDDAEATAELNRYILEKVLDQISPKRITPNLASTVSPVIMLLADSLDMEDSCWEERLRTVVKLFHKSQSHSSPAVIVGVTLACLNILQNVIYPKDAVKSKDKKKLFIEDCSSLLGDDITIKASDWLRRDESASFVQWRSSISAKTSKLESMGKEEVHRYRLMEKYAKIWRRKTVKVSQSRSLLRHDSWLRSMLFNPSSQSARNASSDLVESLCQVESRHRQVLDLLCGFLDQVGHAGEHAQEYLELLHRLTADSSGKWKTYLAMRGVLPQIGNLISMEIEHISQLEDTSMSFNLSQGYALKMLIVLLQSFLQVDTIKKHFKGKLVGVVLNGYLSLKRLVVQRTKRIDESQELLLQMLEDLTSGTDQERQDFMATCVETLNRFRDSDMVTPIFVFERLCNIIHPEENDVGEFYLSLDKDPQQEEFLQGRMQGNPYPSATPGLGPLMRDVKNKICTDCELVALLEDDTGMELLVSNKIISLDLPVKDVYRKVWCSQPNRGECMRVVYRMRGLLGDATEDMVEQLDDGKDKDVNEEEEYKMAAILSECGGLDAILSRLSHVKDFIQGHNLISAALKLLGFCVKLKQNRRYLLQTHLNTLNTLLGTLDMSLYYEERNSTGIGAAVAEKTLKVTERFLQEASSETAVLVRTTSQETDGGELAPLAKDDDRLQVFLKHIESSFVQSNPAIREGLMHIIPFLTFGDPRHMNVLLQHFEPYLDFDKFDHEQSAENTLYLDCFCVVTSGIGKDASGEKLKDLAKETGLTPLAVAYLKKKVPHKIGSFETPEWKSCISQPSLPYILKVLTGLSHWHTKTQQTLMEVIPELHLLEQVASEQNIGTLAENLLETMAEHPPCYVEIKKVRKATREEKKKKAMAMRNKELGALGMQVNEKGQVIAQSALLSEMESQLIEESGLRCCICLEGYKNQPQKILGIYTYTRKVALDEFENKPRKTQGYSTVSHFNVVHYDCHSAAVKLARSRDEWESATLQNANTKCNGLLPIWGTEITATNFASSVARFHNYLQECTGLFDPSFHTLTHDLRLLLLRFAYEKSFSAESGGGGPQSNMYLLPYFVHVGAYVMNASHCYQREERNLTNFLTASVDKWVSSSYELDGPVYCTVVSLFVHSLAQWEEHKVMFLKRLLVLAHARNTSSSLIKSLPSSAGTEFSMYRPLLMLFALVNSLQRMLKKSLDPVLTGSELIESLLEYIRAHDNVILEGCDKLIVGYEAEVLTCESFEEFCDVLGLLGDVDNPSVFLADLLSSVMGP